MLRAIIIVWGLVLLTALGACDESSKCTAGETSACTCANGNSGERTCRSDGELGACICATVTSDVVVTPDAAVADSDCVPKCEGWTCGDDGCGGSCGTCPGNDDCLNGACTGCESFTCCDLRFLNPVPGLTGFGGGCTDDRDCVFQECMMPGDDGNTTNSLFGFCTRGCDCNGAAAKLSDAEKEDYVCLYPSGFASAHHVVIYCKTLEDCLKRDSRWTACGTAPGTTAKVCLAQ
ncbi:MAG: hypothetical protein R3F39_14275 [Myxococcota bacterium]